MCNFPGQGHEALASPLDVTRWKSTGWCSTARPRGGRAGTGDARCKGLIPGSNDLTSLSWRTMFLKYIRAVPLVEIGEGVPFGYRSIFTQCLYSTDPNRAHPDAIQTVAEISPRRRARFAPCDTSWDCPTATSMAPRAPGPRRAALALPPGSPPGLWTTGLTRCSGALCTGAVYGG